MSLTELQERRDNDYMRKARTTLFGQTDSWRRFKIAKRTPPVETIDGLAQRVEEAPNPAERWSIPDTATFKVVGGQVHYNVNGTDIVLNTAPLGVLCDLRSMPVICQYMEQTPESVDALLQSAKRNPWISSQMEDGLQVLRMDLPSELDISPKAASYMRDTYGTLIARNDDPLKTALWIAGFDPHLTIAAEDGYMAKIDIKPTLQITYGPNVPQWLTTLPEEKAYAELQHIAAHNAFARLKSVRTGVVSFSIDTCQGLDTADDCTLAYINYVGYARELNGKSPQEVILEQAMFDDNLDILRQGDTAVLRFTPRNEFADQFFEMLAEPYLAEYQHSKQTQAQLQPQL